MLIKCPSWVQSSLFHLPHGGGGGARGVIKSVREEYQVVKRVREYQGCGEEYNVKRGKRKQYHLPYNIRAVGKNIKLGNGGGERD